MSDLQPVWAVGAMSQLEQSLAKTLQLDPSKPYEQVKITAVKTLEEADVLLMRSLSLAVGEDGSVADPVDYSDLSAEERDQRLL